MGRANAGLSFQSGEILLKELNTAETDRWRKTEERMNGQPRRGVIPFKFVLKQGVGMSYVISTLPCQQLAPGSGHRDEQIPCEFRDGSTSLHTHTHTAYIRHRGANSGATTWSYRAPITINKQHFGWGEMLLSTGWKEREKDGGCAGHR